MEEKQLQEFVHRFSQDEALREELISNPEGVIIREGFSPRVGRVLMRLIPSLTANQFLLPTLTSSYSWI